ncbi:dienelactone hydrolase family protein, partial [Streptomyces sp. NPDC058964]|uniref:dienelactone hydrolase family protein n=1 Tax=Streptomyces sp. NPDC058964 TaxID=3346681 RepID=UPI00369F686C
MTITSETITVPVADGTGMHAYLARPAGRVAPVAVVVAHELFAVNPDIRGVADDLAEAGYLTLAPEFYHRHADPGRWLERTDAGREEGFALLHQLHREEALADVAACLNWLGAQPGIQRTAVIGFSAGGHLAYLAACRLPVSRTAVLYAGWLPTTDIPMSRPTPTLDLTPGISGRIVYLVGQDDALVDADPRGPRPGARGRARAPDRRGGGPRVGHPG